MSYWFRGKRGGVIAFFAIAALLGGGLGWVTSATLRLEHEQREAQAQAEISNQLRIALWRLDSRISPIIAKEDSRPYEHYSALYASPSALRDDGSRWPSGAVLEPSPLVGAELPDWMLLHFQADESGWWSPQVLSESFLKRLQMADLPTPLTNVTPERQRLLADLHEHLRAADLRAHIEQAGAERALAGTALVSAQNAVSARGLEPARQGPNSPRSLDAQSAQGQQAANLEYKNRAERFDQLRQLSKELPQQGNPEVAIAGRWRNGEDWLSENSKKRSPIHQVRVTLGPLIPFWVQASDQRQLLIAARRLEVGSRKVCQGVLLDWQRLSAILNGEVSDLFDSVQLVPLSDSTPAHPERAMAALPVELDPVPPSATDTEWTPRRVGLGLAWAALVVALAAIGLGGWSILDLSERRIRFVSAVTHELRTPLTTLRLYLDMLAGGMVKEERQKDEYLQTLNAEADRLNRLVGNVLDFSRLENQRPRLVTTGVSVGHLLEQVRASWLGRCQSADKELLVENAVGGDVHFVTDVQMVQQILGNLIDNACKYSRGAADRRIWLRARSDSRGRLLFEVEDRGPGVPPGDRRSIFRPFRRGKGSDLTGGVGLGLALAQRWAHLLGGRLTLQPGDDGAGVRFCLGLPIKIASSVVKPR
jgi:signal transduction histidine kinase